MLSTRPRLANASVRLVAGSAMPPAAGAAPTSEVAMEPEPAPGNAPTPAAAPALGAAPMSAPSARSRAAEPFVRVRRVVVKADRMVCDVQLSPACPRTSFPTLVSALLQTHPHLPAHACKNECGTTFGAVMNQTPLIHVLEHVAIDCMVQSESPESASSNALFVGNSRWLDPAQGLGRVELSFRDDIAALRALKTAVEQVNRALASC